jgi:hypothetical protein
MRSKRNMLQRETSKNGKETNLCALTLSLSLWHTHLFTYTLAQTTVSLKLPNCVLFGTNQGRNLQKQTSQRARVLIFLFTCPQNTLLCD